MPPGVQFVGTPATDGQPSGRCLIMVTADAERTLNTYLGAAAEFGPEDVDAEVVSGAQVTYLEGYLWDQPRAKEAFRHAARLAHEAGRRVALTLSDSFCVDRHRADFHDLVERDVDILFANEAEIRSLYEVDDFDAALQRVNHHCEIAALTRSAKGSLIVRGDEVHVIDAQPVPGGVVDTTGAGDQYAAGFLYGFTHGHDLGTCGRLGAIAAAEVISHLGARPEISLADLAASADRLGVKLPRYRTGDAALDDAIASLVDEAGATAERRRGLRAGRVGRPPRPRPRRPRRPQARERGAEGDALLVPRVRALPGAAQGVDLRFGAYRGRRSALRPGPPARRRHRGA